MAWEGRGQLSGLCAYQTRSKILGKPFGHCVERSSSVKMTPTQGTSPRPFRATNHRQGLRKSKRRWNCPKIKSSSSQGQMCPSWSQPAQARPRQSATQVWGPIGKVPAARTAPWALQRGRALEGRAGPTIPSLGHGAMTAASPSRSLQTPRGILSCCASLGKLTAE